MGYEVAEDCVGGEDSAASKFKPQYIIALNSWSSTMCVCLKGSENIENFLTNGYFMPITVDAHHFQVHAGYWSSIKEHYHPIFEMMNLIQKKKNLISAYCF